MYPIVEPLATTPLSTQVPATTSPTTAPHVTGSPPLASNPPGPTSPVAPASASPGPLAQWWAASGITDSNELQDDWNTFEHALQTATGKFGAGPAVETAAQRLVADSTSILTQSPPPDPTVAAAWVAEVTQFVRVGEDALTAYSDWTVANVETLNSAIGTLESLVNACNSVLANAL